MAWGRILNVYAGKTLDGLPVDVSKELSGSGNFIQLVGAPPGETSLACDADIRRSNRMSKNTATVKVYNLPETIRTYLKEDGLLLRIDAGYEDSGFGTIFYGAFGGAQSYLQDAVWTTEISAFHFRAKSMAYETLFVSFSYAPGVTYRQIFTEIQAVLGVPVIGIGGLGDAKPDNGFVHVGTMGAALKLLSSYLRSIEFGMFIDLAELILYRTGSVKDAKGRFETVYLDNTTGLLNARRHFAGVKEARQEIRSLKKMDNLNKAVAKTRSADGKTRTDQAAARTMAQLKLDEVKRERVQFECLANHRLRPSGLVQINHQDVVGPFVVDDISAKLSNYAKDFTFKVGASREP